MDAVHVPPRRLALLVELDRATTAQGYPPTVRELGAAVGLRSPYSVVQHLDALVGAGLVDRKPGAARALVVTRLGRRVVDEHLLERDRASAAAREG